MKKYQETYQYWLKNITDDQELRDELLNIQSRDDEIEDRFFRELEFGTGGGFEVY